MRSREGRCEVAEETLILLRWRLHEAAIRHEPDRERIWTRVETAMLPPRNRSRKRPRPSRQVAWSGLRVAATALGTAAVMCVTSLTVLTNRAGRLPDTLSAGADAGGISPYPVRPAPAVAPPGDGTAPAGAHRPHAVHAIGRPTPIGIPHWGENTLRLRVRRPLDRLEITIRVVRTRWVRPTGSWLSPARSAFRTTGDARVGAVVYRWTLRPGHTVPPGSYTFAARYDRDVSHDPGADTFLVSATTGGTDVRIDGHF